MNPEYYYRYYDYSTGRFDDDGEFAGYAKPEIGCMTLVVEKRTPKGVWLGSGYGTDRRFLKLGTRKQYACATQEEALASFKARKSKQLSILKSQHDHVVSVLKLIESPTFSPPPVYLLPIYEAS